MTGQLTSLKRERVKLLFIAYIFGYLASAFPLGLLTARHSAILKNKNIGKRCRKKERKTKPGKSKCHKLICIYSQIMSLSFPAPLFFA